MTVDEFIDRILWERKLMEAETVKEVQALREEAA